MRRTIGVIPQAMTSDTELSVEENLIIFAKLYGVPREKRRRLIDELLAAVELTEWRDKPVAYLSGGMRRRVEIARGLVHEPRIFFLDEPTTGLDPVSRMAVWEMIRKIKRERDLTVLITTHYMDEADKLCDRIAIVDHGKLVVLDSPMHAQGVDSQQQRAGGVLRQRALRTGCERLQQLPHVQSVTVDGAGLSHLHRQRSGHRPRALIARAAEAGVTRAVAVGEEHDAGRRVRALHGA